MRRARDQRPSQIQSPRRELTAISLFTGAGGLDLGLEAAGFKVRLCVELDLRARETLATNRPSWPLSVPGDIHQVIPKTILEHIRLRAGEVTLLSGGPPCQPFSKSGYWANGDTGRLRDPRSRTLNAYLRLVEATLPEVLIFENVKGILFVNKDEGLELLRRDLMRINRKHNVKYVPCVILINAADYGVPQLRERVFVVAHRGGKKLLLPEATHGPCENGRLLWGDKPYRSAWDAIGDLDRDDESNELKATGKWAALLPSIPEGENYLWHTPRGGGMSLFGWRTRYWSFLLKLSKSKPSWTIQAQPGPATGPFHWRSRRLSIQELCRLQTFPEGYEVRGSYREAFLQIGNAVPSALGELLGLEIRRQLLDERPRHHLRLACSARRRCPGPEPLRLVPKIYRAMRGAHPEHPGPGFGPRAISRGDGPALDSLAAESYSY